MTRIFAILLSFSLLLSLASSTGAGRVAGRDSLRRAAVRDGWPDTDAGLVAARWVRAFSRGEPAMRECLAAILSPESLAKRGMAERMETYRELRERLGELQLVKVVKSTPTEVTASLAGTDLTTHDFTFEIQASAPHKLMRVSFQDVSHQGHGGFSH